MDKQKEDAVNRRQFFKRLASKTLPIIGAILSAKLLIDFAVANIVGLN